MSRPTTKKQLLEAIEVEQKALDQLLAELSLAQMTQPGIVGEWSVKDVLAHLLEWQQMVLNWYSTGLKGKVPAIPAEGLNWSQIPELNPRCARSGSRLRTRLPERHSWQAALMN